ncbi:hypothetical protein [Noviherbaspirillum suwonense]|uniref:hypothetical protein n=1 Tax=Noviherbaspirillum suwonense TaxID=1224511 RepID=UPI0024B811AB|nr:hypothetical protein [Noviherbaspirillum suwonense]
MAEKAGAATGNARITPAMSVEWRKDNAELIMGNSFFHHMGWRRYQQLKLLNTDHYKLG